MLVKILSISVMLVAYATSVTAEVITLKCTGIDPTFNFRNTECRIDIDNNVVQYCNDIVGPYSSPDSKNARITKNGENYLRWWKSDDTFYELDRSTLAMKGYLYNNETGKYHGDRSYNFQCEIFRKQL
jgi:hypothetical protein